MNILTSKNTNIFVKRCISLFIILTFFVSSILPPAYAQTGKTVTLGNIQLPTPGTMLPPSDAYAPPILRGVKVNFENPFEFDFIVEEGTHNLTDDELKAETTKLAKYFLASLTIPEEDMWVNLSPYEDDRIIPNQFGQTEMGRDLLAQDYILKQLTASMIYPEDDLGKAFWQKVYRKAQEQFGTSDIPLNTFNKVWVLPDEVVIYEKEGTAFILESRLKVMLDEDYKALDENRNSERFGTNQMLDEEIDQVSQVSSEAIRDLIVPAIEEEVNQGKHFANLRQVYHSLVLATWYKMKIQNSLLNKIYSDQNKIAGVDVEDKEIKQKIYDQYLAAFKQGVYDYIKEDYDPISQQLIPRKYFSGGVSLFGSNVEGAMRFEGDVGAGVMSSISSLSLKVLGLVLLCAACSPNKGPQTGASPGPNWMATGMATFKQVYNEVFVEQFKQRLQVGDERLIVEILTQMKQQMPTLKSTGLPGEVSISKTVGQLNEIAQEFGYVVVEGVAPSNSDEMFYLYRIVSRDEQGRPLEVQALQEPTVRALWMPYDSEAMLYMGPTDAEGMATMTVVSLDQQRLIVNALDIFKDMLGENPSREDAIESLVAVSRIINHGINETDKQAQEVLAFQAQVWLFLDEVTRLIRPLGLIAFTATNQLGIYDIEDVDEEYGFLKVAPAIDLIFPQIFAGANTITGANVFFDSQIGADLNRIVSSLVQTGYSSHEGFSRFSDQDFAVLAGLFRAAMASGDREADISNRTERLFKDHELNHSLRAGLLFDAQVGRYRSQEEVDQNRLSPQTMERFDGYMERHIEFLALEEVLARMGVLMLAENDPEQLLYTLGYMGANVKIGKIEPRLTIGLLMLFEEMQGTFEWDSAEPVDLSTIQERLAPVFSLTDEEIMTWLDEKRKTIENGSEEERAAVLATIHSQAKFFYAQILALEENYFDVELHDADQLLPKSQSELEEEKSEYKSLEDVPVLADALAPALEALQRLEDRVEAEYSRGSAEEERKWSGDRRRIKGIIQEFGDVNNFNLTLVKRGLSALNNINTEEYRNLMQELENLPGIYLLRPLSETTNGQGVLWVHGFGDQPSTRVSALDEQMAGQPLFGFLYDTEESIGKNADQFHAEFLRLKQVAPDAVRFIGANSFGATVLRLALQRYGEAGDYRDVSVMELAPKIAGVSNLKYFWPTLSWFDPIGVFLRNTLLERPLNIVRALFPGGDIQNEIYSQEATEALKQNTKKVVTVIADVDLVDIQSDEQKRHYANAAGEDTVVIQAEHSDVPIRPEVVQLAQRLSQFTYGEITADEFTNDLEQFKAEHGVDPQIDASLQDQEQSTEGNASAQFIQPWRFDFETQTLSGGEIIPATIVVTPDVDLNIVPEDPVELYNEWRRTFEIATSGTVSSAYARIMLTNLKASMNRDISRFKENPEIVNEQWLINRIVQLQVAVSDRLYILSAEIFNTVSDKVWDVFDNLMPKINEAFFSKDVNQMIRLVRQFQQEMGEVKDEVADWDLSTLVIFSAHNQRYNSGQILLAQMEEMIQQAILKRDLILNSLSEDFDVDVYARDMETFFGQVLSQADQYVREGKSTQSLGWYQFVKDGLEAGFEVLVLPIEGNDAFNDPRFKPLLDIRQRAIDSKQRAEISLVYEELKILKQDSLLPHVFLGIQTLRKYMTALFGPTYQGNVSEAEIDAVFEAIDAAEVDIETVRLIQEGVTMIESLVNFELTIEQYLALIEAVNKVKELIDQLSDENLKNQSIWIVRMLDGLIKEVEQREKIELISGAASAQFINPWQFDFETQTLEGGDVIPAALNVVPDVEVDTEPIDYIALHNDWKRVYDAAVFGSVSLPVGRTMLFNLHKRIQDTLRVIIDSPEKMVKDKLFDQMVATYGDVSSQLYRTSGQVFRDAYERITGNYNEKMPLINEAFTAGNVNEVIRLVSEFQQETETMREEFATWDLESLVYLSGSENRYRYGQTLLSMMEGMNQEAILKRDILLNRVVPDFDPNLYVNDLATLFGEYLTQADQYIKDGMPSRARPLYSLVIESVEREFGYLVAPAQRQMMLNDPRFRPLLDLRQRAIDSKERAEIAVVRSDLDLLKREGDRNGALRGVVAVRNHINALFSSSYRGNVSQFEIRAIQQEINIAEQDIKTVISIQAGGEIIEYLAKFGLTVETYTAVTAAIERVQGLIGELSDERLQRRSVSLLKKLNRLVKQMEEFGKLEKISQQAPESEAEDPAKEISGRLLELSNQLKDMDPYGRDIDDVLAELDAMTQELGDLKVSLLEIEAQSDSIAIVTSQALIRLIEEQVILIRDSLQELAKIKQADDVIADLKKKEAAADDLLATEESLFNARQNFIAMTEEAESAITTFAIVGLADISIRLPSDRYYDGRLTIIELERLAYIGTSGRAWSTRANRRDPEKINEVANQYYQEVRGTYIEVIQLMDEELALGNLPFVRKAYQLLRSFVEQDTSRLRILGVDEGRVNALENLVRETEFLFLEEDAPADDQDGPDDRGDLQQNRSGDIREARRRKRGGARRGQNVDRQSVDSDQEAPNQDEAQAETQGDETGDGQNLGGIDFNPNRINFRIENDGEPLEFEFDEQQIENINIDGFVPYIINIQPVHNLPLLLGLNEDEEELFEQLSRSEF